MGDNSVVARQEPSRMVQTTFADLEYDSKKRKTRGERSLERMEALIPWERLETRVAPVYPKTR